MLPVHVTTFNHVPYVGWYLLAYCDPNTVQATKNHICWNDGDRQLVKGSASDRYPEYKSVYSLIHTFIHSFILLHLLLLYLHCLAHKSQR